MTGLVAAIESLAFKQEAVSSTDDTSVVLEEPSTPKRRSWHDVIVHILKWAGTGEHVAGRVCIFSQVAPEVAAVLVQYALRTLIGSKL